MKITPFTPQNTQNRRQNAQPRTQAQPNFKGLITVKTAGSRFWEVKTVFEEAAGLIDNCVEKGYGWLKYGFAGAMKADGVDVTGQLALLTDTIEGQTNIFEQMLIKNLKKMKLKITEGELTNNTFNHLTFANKNKTPDRISNNFDAMSYGRAIITSVNKGVYTSSREGWEL